MLHIAAFLANMGDLLNISAGPLTYIKHVGGRKRRTPVV